MTEIVERLEHYNTKCRQHLHRVRLSHELALGTVRDKQPFLDKKYEELVRKSFSSTKEDEYVVKVCAGLHKLHLVSLKMNFELFLNRLLSTVWTIHFTELTSKISDEVSLRELAASFMDIGETSPNVREFIIDKTVPRHGLTRFEKALEKATGIGLKDVLNHKNFHHWPQISTAFAVRHLVEHRDGKVDNQFRKDVEGFWPNSSWGRRVALKGLRKVVVEEEDVRETCSSMLEATDLLTEKVIQWSTGGIRLEPSKTH